MKELPRFELCENNYKHGTAKPLEVFIYNNTPVGDSEEEVFRKELLAALNTTEAHPQTDNTGMDAIALADVNAVLIEEPQLGEAEVDHIMQKMYSVARQHHA